MGAGGVWKGFEEYVIANRCLEMSRWIWSCWMRLEVSILFYSIFSIYELNKEKRCPLDTLRPVSSISENFLNTG